MQFYGHKSYATIANAKLSPRFYGPCEILDQFGNIAYKVVRSTSTCIHTMFNVSQLKKTIPSGITITFPSKQLKGIITRIIICNIETQKQYQYVFLCVYLTAHVFLNVSPEQRDSKS